MSGNVCTCNRTFRMGEDFRDHMPCPGTAQEAAERRLDRIRQIWRNSESYDKIDLCKAIGEALDD